MPNANAPFGLKPIGHISGAPWNGAVRICYIPSGTATNFFVGDAVQLAGSADTTGRYPSVAHATITDGGFIFGVITGFVNIDTGAQKSAFPDDLRKVYGPASTIRFCEVCCDPSTVFIIQDDGGAALTVASVGLNAVGIGTMSTAGSTTTGLSGLELDAGTTTAPSTDASNPFFILCLHDREDNEIGVNAIWEVLINMHTLRSTGDGDGSLGV